MANLVALGGARQWAFEQRGADPARDSVHQRCRIYAKLTNHLVHVTRYLSRDSNRVATINDRRLDLSVVDSVDQVLPVLEGFRVLDVQTG